MRRPCPNCGAEVPVVPGFRNFTVAHVRPSPAPVVGQRKLVFCLPAVQRGPGWELPESTRRQAWEDDSLWDGL